MKTHPKIITDNVMSVYIFINDRLRYITEYNNDYPFQCNEQSLSGKCMKYRYPLRMDLQNVLSTEQFVRSTELLVRMAENYSQREWLYVRKETFLLAAFSRYISGTQSWHDIPICTARVLLQMNGNIYFEFLTILCTCIRHSSVTRLDNQYSL